MFSQIPFERKMSHCSSRRGHVVAVVSLSGDDAGPSTLRPAGQSAEAATARQPPLAPLAPRPLQSTTTSPRCNAGSAAHGSGVPRHLAAPPVPPRRQRRRTTTTCQLRRQTHHFVLRRHHVHVRILAETATVPDRLLCAVKGQMTLPRGS